MSKEKNRDKYASKEESIEVVVTEVPEQAEQIEPELVTFDNWFTRFQTGKLIKLGHHREPLRVFMESKGLKVATPEAFEEMLKSY